MRARCKSWLLTIAAVLVLTMTLLSAVGIDAVVTTVSENITDSRALTVVIDAGHGGEDGGATSCTGILESQLNLEIALKLNDLFHLMGVRTVMIRTTDQSVYTSGHSLAEKKVSDLKQRVRIVNDIENAVLISIHQNHYPDNRYKGAQVFYTATNDSYNFAKSMQDTFVMSLNKGSNRQIKKADGIYLMEHISCPGILVECGFISNPEEEAMIRDSDYQKKLCCVIASVCSEYFAREGTLT